MEEIYWKQKVISKHVLDGDRNTKYYHAFVKKNRMLNCITKIKLSNGSLSDNKKRGILP